MDTRLVRADDPDAIGSALAVLQAGGLVAFPTDTVYGVGALLFNQQAVESIYTVKGRSGEKAIPILIPNAAALEQVALSVTDIARRLVERFWPGPLTVVVLKRPELPSAVSATDTVGVRVPDHPVARALLLAAGPMAVSSANLSGEPSPRTAAEVMQQLGGKIALIIDGGTTPGGVPSTVLDCTKPEPVVLRVGPVSAADIGNAVH